MTRAITLSLLVLTLGACCFVDHGKLAAADERAAAALELVATAAPSSRTKARVDQVLLQAAGLLRDQAATLRGEELPGAGE